MLADMGDYRAAAWEAGKFIIRERYGQAVALVVFDSDETHVLLNDVINCWVHHQGKMTVEAEIVSWAELDQTASQFMTGPMVIGMSDFRVQ